MRQDRTDTCECGRPEVGPRHCPVHGDGKPQPTEQATPRDRSTSTGRGRRRREKPATK